ncbi:aldo/keto reductase [Streptomyces lavendulae]|uniref:aldo/keto reductase n=1 Tax=Streptomyces lavendulae TaxID=1914 RepID=UPI0033D38A7C
MAGRASARGPHVPGARRGAGRADYVAPLLTEDTFVVLDALERIALDLGTTVAAVAPAWVRQQDPVTSMLVGTRILDQLENNLASAAVALDPSQLAELSAPTTPELNYPHPFTEGLGIGFLQGDTTVNGVTSVAFRRS